MADPSPGVRVYLCTCGGAMSARLDPARLREELLALPGVTGFEVLDYACSPEGAQALQGSLAEHRPDRALLAGCSPHEHGATLQAAAAGAGLDPSLLHRVNVREHVAWVTPDPEAATRKAGATLRASVRRAQRQRPSAPRRLEVCTSVLVVGAGPAGLGAALTLAEAGREVTLLDLAPSVGGAPMRFDDLAPGMECASCTLGPMVTSAVLGARGASLKTLTLTEVVSVRGSFGNFLVTLRRRARHVDVDRCIGCRECLPPCPVTLPGAHGEPSRGAIAFALPGALPNAPYVDEGACVRWRGGDCAACRDACPVEGCLDLDARDEVTEARFGALILAVGAGTYDLRRVPSLGLGRVPDVVSSPDFERRLAASRGTGEALRTHDGRPVRRVAIVHCAGSLDERHVPWCSATCCAAAFKYRHALSSRDPDVEVLHFVRTISVPGREGYRLYQASLRAPRTRFVTTGGPGDVRVVRAPTGGPAVWSRALDGSERTEPVDLVVLMAPTVPSPGAAPLARALGVPLDDHGFFAALSGVTGATESPVRGVYLAGSCQGPGDVSQAITEGRAAAGQALSALVPGRTLTLDPAASEVDPERCARCGVCASSCPFQAIEAGGPSGLATVTASLCVGCGTCVAACPAGAIEGRQHATEELLAELDEALS